LDPRTPGAHGGKSGRVSVNGGITLTQSVTNIQAEMKVLGRGEALREDDIPTTCPNPIDKCIDTTPITFVSSELETMQIIDLYMAGHVMAIEQQVEAKKTVPFLHQVSLEGLRGEIVRVRALFNDGAMVGAMCVLVLNKVKYRLHNWSQSK
jgi:hypothetical protein